MTQNQIDLATFIKDYCIKPNYRFGMRDLELICLAVSQSKKKSFFSFSYGNKDKYGQIHPIEFSLQKGILKGQFRTHGEPQVIINYNEKCERIIFSLAFSDDGDVIFRVYSSPLKKFPYYLDCQTRNGFTKDWSRELFTLFLPMEWRDFRMIFIEMNILKEIKKMDVKGDEEAEGSFEHFQRIDVVDNPSDSFDDFQVVFHEKIEKLGKSIDSIQLKSGKISTRTFMISQKEGDKRKLIEEAEKKFIEETMELKEGTKEWMEAEKKFIEETMDIWYQDYLKTFRQELTKIKTIKELKECYIKVFEDLYEEGYSVDPNDYAISDIREIIRKRYNSLNGKNFENFEKQVFNTTKHLY